MAGRLLLAGWPSPAVTYSHVIVITIPSATWHSERIDYSTRPLQHSQHLYKRMHARLLPRCRHAERAWETRVDARRSRVTGHYT